MRTRLILVLSIVALVGCQLPHVTPPGTSGDGPAHGDGAHPQAAPKLAGRISFAARSVQTSISDVARAATVSLIHTGNNQTVDTALTDAEGKFVLNFANGYVADPQAVYYLEAIKGLGDNLPGHEAVRVRTIVKYQNGWTSLTNTAPNTGIQVTPATTALSIAAALRHGEPLLDFAAFIGSLSGENAATYTPVTGVSSTDFTEVTAMVASTLAANRDPVQRIALFRPSSWHLLDQAIAISAIAPSSGNPGTSVTLSGTGFPSTASELTVTFNGVEAPVSAATPLSLTTQVPFGATSGPTNVRFGQLVALGPNFTVPLDTPLLAVNPQSAPVGAVVTLEGTFESETTVSFAGASPVAAEVLGPRRAKVTIPPGATSGPLTVTSGAITSSLPFHVLADEATLASFKSKGTISDARFNAALVHAQGHVYMVGGSTKVSSKAQQALSILRAPVNADGELGSFVDTGVSLGSGRDALTAHRIGSYLYAIGGTSASAGALKTVERALIQADGSLGAFEPAGTLTVPRLNHSSVIVGNYLYVIGGSSSTHPLPLVERALIHADGSLGAFEFVGALFAPRQKLTTEIIGNYLYVIGGSYPYGFVERAAIQANGNLGSFERVESSNLTTSRDGHASAVIGEHLYVFNGGFPLYYVERALIDSDGKIGNFSRFDDVKLYWPRQNASSILLGSRFHILGGLDFDGFATNSLETALITAP